MCRLSKDNITLQIRKDITQFLVALLLRSQPVQQQIQVSISRNFSKNHHQNVLIT